MDGMDWEEEGVKKQWQNKNSAHPKSKRYLLLQASKL